MSDALRGDEATALDEQQDEAVRVARRSRPSRPSFKHFGIRYSQWGGECKSYCYHCEYGTRGKAVKSAIAHVTAVHACDGGQLAGGAEQ